jgi:hypothetical protein
MKVATNRMTKKTLALKVSNWKRKIVRPANPLVLALFSPLILRVISTQRGSDADGVLVSSQGKRKRARLP